MTHVTCTDIREGIRVLRLSGKPVCAHSSLRSFGWVEGGAAIVVEAFLAEGCTLMVPSFSGIFTAPLPPPEWRPVQNGWNYARWKGPTWPEVPTGQVYTTDTLEINKDMGAISAAVVRMPGRVRGNHPLGSFTAIGPHAQELVGMQKPNYIYAPLQALADMGGFVVLMGVDLDSMTLLHRAEELAGRRPFIRWANSTAGRPVPVQDGGCSSGFHHLKPVLAHLITSRYVGESLWQVLPAREALEAASQAIQANPRLTHCDDPHCDRCNDVMLGGPMFIPMGARPVESKLAGKAHASHGN